MSKAPLESLPVSGLRGPTDHRRVVPKSWLRSSKTCHIANCLESDIRFCPKGGLIIWVPGSFVSVPAMVGTVLFSAAVDPLQRLLPLNAMHERFEMPHFARPRLAAIRFIISQASQNNRQ